MIEIYLVAAVALIAAGVAIGVVAVVSLGIRHEEKAFSLRTDIAHRVARGARVANGLHVRGASDLAREDQPPPADTLVQPIRCRGPAEVLVA